MGSGDESLVAVRGLTKSFGGVHALNGVDFAVGSGEVVGLVGENGAGKSTLLKILAGLYAPDEGEILVAGEPTENLTPKLSQDLGFSFIHQEVQIVPGMSVAESIYLGMPVPNRLGWIDRGKVRKSAAEVLARLGLDIDPATTMSQLSLVQQVSVSIARAISRESRLVVMDEPTASFSPREVERLFEIVRRLRDHDCAVIYVSHRLDEIFALCERATVMRSGRNVAERQIEGLTKERLIADIIGDDLSGHLAGRVFDLPDPGEPLLRVEGLQSDYIGPIDLTVRRGEIVGLGGLVGSGRSRLIKALYGVERRVAGSVEVDGRKLSRGTSREAVSAGLGLVPEDRGREGFMSTLSIRENATLPTLQRFTRAFAFVRKRSQRAAVEKVGTELRIKMASTEMPISGLSGGNQQKVVIAKWLLADSKLLIFDEPTRGIDIGAKEDVFRMMVDAARAGAGVIVASSELEELYGLCHRVLVMREGQMVGELGQDDATPQRILELCYGR